jgi:hypothetical protein
MAVIKVRAIKPKVHIVFSFLSFLSELFNSTIPATINGIEKKWPIVIMITGEKPSWDKNAPDSIPTNINAKVDFSTSIFI